MPQSLTQLYAHLVFSTKDRRTLIDQTIKSRVHGYIAESLRNLGSPFVVVGGVADHVHILFEMGRLHAPADLVGQIKRESSKFIKAMGSRYDSFYWQNGYGMFSVSPTHRDDVEAYVRRQEEHHRQKSFQEELREFLDRYKIDYDERYVWD